MPTMSRAYIIQVVFTSFWEVSVSLISNSFLPLLSVLTRTDFVQSWTIYTIKRDPTPK